MTGVVFDGVRFAYPDAAAVALDGIDTEIAPGDFALVVGGSGTGKSTLLRAACGLVPHASGGSFGGDVRVGGRSTRDAMPRDLAGVVGFVHQDPEAAFVVDRVEHDIAFVLENLGLDAADMRRRVEEVLDALDIAALRHRAPSSLSGGERQRCAIAAALAAAPGLLVLDEPTSQLDPQGAEDVLAALARLNHDLGTTVLVAEHRLDRAAPLADRALLVDAGAVVDDGAPAVVLAEYPGAPAVTRLGRLVGWLPPPLTVKDARRRVAAGEVPDLASPDTAVPTPGDALLRARGVAVKPGPVVVLDGVDLDVGAGEVVALLGRNGSGKTTLLRTLAGLRDPAAGKVERIGRTAYVPQDPDLLFSAPTVRAELEATQRLLGRHDPAAVDAWLARLGLANLSGRHPRSLSGGQRQRAAVAAVAVGGAPALLLDEPTRGMDAPSREALAACIRDHAAGGGAVVLATHDVELAARVAHTAVVIGGGDVVAQGRARDVLSGSLFAPQTLRVLPPFLTVDEVGAALGISDGDRDGAP
ncbi:MAG: ATP-binding cassette domain-containing protein [Acidimicrobiia bacterium]